MGKAPTTEAPSLQAESSPWIIGFQPLIYTNGGKIKTHQTHFSCDLEKNLRLDLYWFQRTLDQTLSDQMLAVMCTAYRWGVGSMLLLWTQTGSPEVER